MILRSASGFPRSIVSISFSERGTGVGINVGVGTCVGVGIGWFFGKLICWAIKYVNPKTTSKIIPTTMNIITLPFEPGGVGKLGCPVCEGSAGGGGAGGAAGGVAGFGGTCGGAGFVFILA